MRDDELRNAILDYIEDGDRAIIDRAAATLDPLDDDSNPTPLGWAFLHAQAELDTGLVADGAIRRTLVEALLADAQLRAVAALGTVKSGASGYVITDAPYATSGARTIPSNDAGSQHVGDAETAASGARTMTPDAAVAAYADRFDDMATRLTAADEEIATWRRVAIVAIGLLALVCALWIADTATASPRVTPAQAERAAASWTRWYWSAANEDMGGGYTVNDLRVSCERTPQSTRRFVRCAATYNVTDPTDSSADLGSFEDFHRVCRSRRVNKAQHAIAAPNARIARTTIRIRKHVVLDCRYVSFNDTRYG